MRSVMLIMLAFVLAGSFQIQGCGASTDVQAAEAVIQTPSIQCEGCQDTIMNALTSVAGVASVQVNLDDKVTTVTYNPGQTNESALVEAIVQSGYQANDQHPDAEVYSNLPDCCKIP